jgi:hypothetical protein
MPPIEGRYRSFNVAGNLHALCDYLNRMEPTADVVAVHAGGGSVAVLVRDRPAALAARKSTDAQDPS